MTTNPVSIDVVPNATVAQYVQKSFPNLLEVRHNEKGEKTLVFLFIRRNSHRLDLAQTELAHLLQDAGHVVRVSVLGVELTLEQFERQGVYAVKQSNTVLSRQGLYNKTSELRQMEGELAQLDQSDQRFYPLAQRVQHLRAMLSTALGIASHEAIKKSDEGLRRLEALLNAPQPEGDKQDVTSKPVVASEVNTTNTVSEGLPTTVVSPDRREGD